MYVLLICEQKSRKITKLLTSLLSFFFVFLLCISSLCFSFIFIFQSRMHPADFLNSCLMVCFKIALLKMYVTVCSKFTLNEESLTDCGTALTKFEENYANWGVQIEEMTFQMYYRFVGKYLLVVRQSVSTLKLAPEISF